MSSSANRPTAAPFRWLLNSLRGRFLLAAVLVIVALAADNYRAVQQMNAVDLELFARRDMRSGVSAALTETLWRLAGLKGSIYALLVAPDARAEAQLKRDAERLVLVASRFERLAAALDWKQRPNPVPRVVDDIRLLRDQIVTLIQMRADLSSWSPGLDILNQHGRRHNQQVMGELDHLIAAIRAGESGASGESSTRRQFLYLAEDARVGLVLATSEIRLFLSNLFSAFAADSRKALATRHELVQLRLAMSRKRYEALLSAYREIEEPPLEVEDALQALRSDYPQWEQTVSQAVNMLYDEGWRKDVPMTEQRIRPLLERLNVRLSALRLDLDVRSARDVANAVELAATMSRRRLIELGGSIALVLLAFVAFNRLLVRPIRKTVNALDAASRGEKVSLNDAGLAETRALADAFNTMNERIQERERRLDHMAHHDALTGLPNRVLFADRLRHALLLGERVRQPLAVMYLDLDRFKQINDSLGHAIGDRLLQMAAQRIESCLRQSDTVARLGGDEFALLLESSGDIADVERKAERICEALREPFEIDEKHLVISTSIGIAIYPEDGEDGEALLQHADTALYEAKHQGRNAYHFFSEGLGEKARIEHEREMAVHQAWENDQFELFLQPVMRDGEAYFFEALLRWHHPERGLVGPDEFIAALEASGLIGAVTEWIIRRVGALLRTPEFDGLYAPVSINLPAYLFQDAAFTERVIKRMDDGALRGETLIFEFTENSLGEDIDAAVAVMELLRRKQVRFALDDFGTGQSALNNLRRFPFDIIKIDRSFIDDLLIDADDAELVEGIIRMGTALGMEVVAEGIESVEQETALRSLGCDLLQGFLYAEPMNAEACLKRFAHASWPESEGPLRLGQESGSPA